MTLPKGKRLERFHELLQVVSLRLNHHRRRPTMDAHTAFLASMQGLRDNLHSRVEALGREVDRLRSRAEDLERGISAEDEDGNGTGEERQERQERETNSKYNIVRKGLCSERTVLNLRHQRHCIATESSMAVTASEHRVNK